MSGSYQTRRWRDLDSTHRARATHPRFQDRLARDSGQWRYGGANETRGHVDAGHASAGPMVRIRLPPAASQMHFAIRPPMKPAGRRARRWRSIPEFAGLEFHQMIGTPITRENNRNR